MNRPELINLEDWRLVCTGVEPEDVALIPNEGAAIPEELASLGRRCPPHDLLTIIELVRAHVVELLVEVGSPEAHGAGPTILDQLKALRGRLVPPPPQRTPDVVIESGANPDAAVRNAVVCALKNGWVITAVTALERLEDGYGWRCKAAVTSRSGVRSQVLEAKPADELLAIGDAVLSVAHAILRSCPGDERLGAACARLEDVLGGRS